MEPVGALDRLRVVEYGELVSAPFCSRLVADAGAEVIKIEPPGVGDRSRRHGPFPGDIPHPERSGLFLVLNNNKLGVTLDIAQATGRAILLRLLEEADVLVENTPFGELGRLGLDYGGLRGKFPRLIYVSISPYGRTGPYRAYRGYDANGASLGGATEQIGRAPRAPLVPPFEQSGHQAGLAAASACLVAVLARLRGGCGQHVDIAEADVWATTQTGVEYLVYELDGVPGMRGRARAVRPVDSFPPPYWRTKDGIMVGGGAQAAQFERFLEAIGRPEWVTDARFTSRRNLAPEAAHELMEVAMEWFASRTTAENCESSSSLNALSESGRVRVTTATSPVLRTSMNFRAAGSAAWTTSPRKPSS